MKVAIADKKDEQFPGAPPEGPQVLKEAAGKVAKGASDGESH